jgi:hypothetical protein
VPPMNRESLYGVSESKEQAWAASVENAAFPYFQGGGVYPSGHLTQTGGADALIESMWLMCLSDMQKRRFQEHDYVDAGGRRSSRVKGLGETSWD